MAAPVHAATKLDYAPYAKVEYDYTEQVKAGTIRYICQNRTNKYFYWDYWPADQFGSYKKPENECGTACISMALSYLGINKTPKDILTANNGKTIFDGGWGADHLTPTLSKGIDNYLNGNGKYSPVIVHLTPGQTGNGHYVMIVGKVDDNVWQILDPATEKLINYTINGTSLNYMNVANTIDKVIQYYYRDAAPDPDDPDIVNEYPCYATVTTPNVSALWNMPCTDEHAEDAREVGHTNEGGSYFADMIYQNSEGDYWYRITKDGAVCYLFAGNTSVAVPLDPGITVSGLVVPYRLTKGRPFNIEGVVSSPNLPLNKIGAYIYQGMEAAGSPYTFVTDYPNPANSYNIRAGKLNNDLSFGKLPEGLFTYQLTVEVTRYSASSNYFNEETEIVTLAEQLFAVGNQPFDPGSEKYKGIDVRYDQDNIDWDIDWDTVASEIDFAILKCGEGTDLEDRQWRTNADACTRLGIPFGVYIYSHATTEDLARMEAEHVLRLIEGYEPSLPIFLYLEADSITCSNEDILRNTKAFCKIIEDAGYTVGIYANKDWWTKKLIYPEYEQWPRWYAHYGVNKPDFNLPYKIWQYSETGSIPGISGNVDLNYWYGPLPEQSHTHAYEESVTKEPTCTEDGEMTCTCICGDSYTVIIPAFGHDFSDWTLAVEPTPTADGLEVRVCRICNHVDTRPIPHLENSFTDVPENSFFYEPVLWAVENGITNGATATTFNPSGECMRAHIVTFLWRAAGSPVVKAENPFTDVPAGSFYYDAVLWAVENGITAGTSTTTFAPFKTCSRAEVVTFLWRAHGKPGSNAANPFVDVNETNFFHTAVLWAVENGITNGMDATHFGSLNVCNRAQVVTFLYRAFN